MTEQDDRKFKRDIIQQLKLEFESILKQARLSSGPMVRYLYKLKKLGIFALRFHLNYYKSLDIILFYCYRNWLALYQAMNTILSILVEYMRPRVSQRITQ